MTDYIDGPAPSARSVMRTQPSTEGTGAIRTQRPMKDIGSWRCPKIALPLDDRPANGCHRNPQVVGDAELVAVHARQIDPSGKSPFLIFGINVKPQNKK